MRAFYLEEFRGRLVPRETPIPKADDRWLLVRIVRTGVCYRDILTVDGFFPKTRLPIILGHEIAGVVEDVGKGVTKFSKGDEVVSLPYIPCGECEYCRSGRENICVNRRWYGEVVDGSYAEYMLVHEDSAMRMEPRVDWNYAAISSCVIGMLIHVFEDVANIREGAKVLVTGASGGTGIHAVQIAKAYGAETIAVTSSEEKAGFIESVRPDHLIVGVREFSKEVKRIVGGVDLVVEAVGEPTFNQSLRSLKWGGKIVVFGNVNVKPVELPLGLIILRENVIAGAISSTKRTLKKALEMGAKGLVRAIGVEMPLDKVEEAHEILRKRMARGRIFLKP